MSDKKEKPENPQAFPRGVTHDSIYGGRVHGESGMTLRDYFAAKALPEFMTDEVHYEDMAKWSYELADAMLKERSKQPQHG